MFMIVAIINTILWVIYCERRYDLYSSIALWILQYELWYLISAVSESLPCSIWTKGCDGRARPHHQLACERVILRVTGITYEGTRIKTNIITKRIRLLIINNQIKKKCNYAFKVVFNNYLESLFGFCNDFLNAALRYHVLSYGI